jgi:hypothetical protein
MRDGHPSYRAVPEDRRIVLPEDLLAASDIGLLFVDNSLLVQGYSTTILPFVSTEHCAVGRSAFHLSRDLGGTEFVNGIRRVLARQVSEDRTLQSRGGALLICMSPAVMRVGPGVLVTVANVSAVTRNYDVVRRVLDSLPANIAFLDRLGNIRLTNGAWDRFGAENGRELGASLVGANYLDACAGSIGDVALNGIRSVLDGTAPDFDMEYPCESTTELRWFIMRCSSTGDGNVVVSHFDITALSCLEMGETLRGSGPVHVNCYPSTLLNMSAERLAAIFEPAGRGAMSVVVELSEQQILGDPSSLIPVLQQLRAAGVKVALDDVGFGRTSLEALILLQPDIIKVDQAFVHGIAEDAARRGNIARLVRVVEALGAELIAEGVELQADADVLVELGVTFAQGFLFGRPELIEATGLCSGAAESRQHT